MQQDLIYPWVNNAQPITDNVEEAASGVKGSIAVKVFGHDLYQSEKTADDIYDVLKTTDGIEDSVIRNIGQRELVDELTKGSLPVTG